jgi:hypothetical protein
VRRGTSTREMVHGLTVENHKTIIPGRLVVSRTPDLSVNCTTRTETVERAIASW